MGLAKESDGKNETPNQPETPPPPAVPPAMTLPYFSKGIKDVLTAFLGKLIQNGVPRDKVNKALTETIPEIQKTASAANNAFLVAITKYLDRKIHEGARKDYLGRALLFDLDQYLPKDEETRDQLALKPIQGFLPPQIAEGLVTALKSAHGMDTIKEYDAICKAKVEQYRSGADGLIDVENFVNDPEVKKLVMNITTRFRLLLHKKSEADQKKWISNQISTSYSFRGMKRDLTDEELGVITQSFLKIK